MTWRIICLVCFLPAFCLTLFPKFTFAEDPAAAIIARVGNKNITRGDFERRFAEINQLSLSPPTREEFLQDLIRYEMGLQEAARRNLQNDPIVQERIRQELYKALVEKELGKKIEQIRISEREMKNYYQRNPEIQVQHILLEVRRNATAEQREAARKRAMEIYQEIRRSNRPFEDFVQLYSDDSISKRMNGNLGYQGPNTMLPQQYSAARNLRNGAISQPVQTAFGFHIIRRISERPYEEANKLQVRAAVFDEKRRKLFDDFFTNLQKEYPVRINRANLR